MVISGASVVRIELIDRGDPAAFDANQASMTLNDAWQDLDLSAIVPAEAAWILLRSRIHGPDINAYLYFRKNGNANEINTPGQLTQAANVTIEAHILVPCSAARIIEYKGLASLTVVDITVLGWIFGS